MQKLGTVIAAFVLVIAACGGDSGDDAQVATTGGASSATTTAAAGSGDGDDGAGGGGDVVNRQAAGMAAVSIDGQEFSFDTVGPVGCSVSDSQFIVGFIIGDNDVNVLANATASGSEWQGRIDVSVQDADGLTTYSADFAGGDGGAVAVDGSSLSYSGDWEVWRPGAADAEAAGQGTLSATC